MIDFRKHRHFCFHNPGKNKGIRTDRPEVLRGSYESLPEHRSQFALDPAIYMRMLTQTQPRTRELLRQVAREYDGAKWHCLVEKRAEHKMVRFSLDLLIHLEGQLKELGNELNLP